MKGFYLLIFGLSVVMASCEKHDLRNDMDNLESKIERLESNIDKLNEEISVYYDMLNGQVLVREYIFDEATGNYQVELTDGRKLVVYSGEVDMSSMPQFSVNAFGNWAYTINGNTEEILINGEPVKMDRATDGKKGTIPQLGVDDNGYWIVSVDGEKWERLPGNDIASGDNVVNGGLFSNVRKVENEDLIVFTLRSTGEEVTVPLDEFSLEINTESVGLEFKAGESKEYPVTQKGIKNAMIMDTAWGVQLTEDKLLVTAPSINVTEKTDESIYIKIFSASNLSKFVKLEVSLSPSE